MALLGVLVACQAWEIWTPFGAEALTALGLSTTLQLCHNQADLSNHPEACASGTRVLRAIDGHTRCDA